MEARSESQGQTLSLADEILRSRCLTVAMSGVVEGDLGRWSFEVCKTLKQTFNGLVVSRSNSDSMYEQCGYHTVVTR